MVVFFFFFYLRGTVISDFGQPRSQGLSFSRFLGSEEERPWERGCTLVKTVHIFDKKNLFCNMKLHLQHWEENIKVFLGGRTNHNQF